MASNKKNFFELNKDKTEVFVEKSRISDLEFRHIMNNDVKVVVPKLKLQPNHIQYLTKRSDYKNGDQLRGVLNNQSNVGFDCLTDNDNTDRPKRKLRSNSVSKDKKQKYDFRPIDRNTVNVNKCEENRKKNKENNQNNNLELSRIIGLPNMGNTCYINSIIQVLRMTPGFRQFVCSLNKTNNSNKSVIKLKTLKTSNKQLITSLHNIFLHFGDNEIHINRSTNSSTNESKISDLIECEDIKNRFEFGQQQDCHEFFNWLINELNSFAEILFPNKNIAKNLVKSVYNTRKKQSIKSMTYQSFQGVMLRNITCIQCQKRSSTRDSFADIQIPLCATEEVTGTETQTFTEIIHRRDYLKDENMFDCRNCSKKTNAFVFNSIETLPKVLILFIKKPFEYNQINTRNVKPMRKLFKVPLSLEYQTDVPSEPIHYSLYAFVMHNGSDIDNGHYYAVIDSGVAKQKRRNTSSVCSCALNVLANNGWIKVNDHKVTKLSTSHLNKLLDNDSIHSTPYLAFYHKND